MEPYEISEDPTYLETKVAHKLGSSVTNLSSEGQIYETETNHAYLYNYVYTIYTPTTI